MLQDEQGQNVLWYAAQCPVFPYCHFLNILGQPRRGGEGQQKSLIVVAFIMVRWWGCCDYNQMQKKAALFNMIRLLHLL